MAQKIQPSLFFKRLPIFRNLNHRTYSVRSAARLHSPIEADQSASESAEFVSLVESLKNKLQSDRLIRALVSTSDLSLALNLFRWASRQKKFCLTAATYAHMILRLGLLGDQQEMEVLLKEMKALDLPNVEQAFSSLISSFSENKRPMEALQVFEHSTIAKIPLSTCNVLLSSLTTRSGAMQSVLFVYKEMVKAGIPPDVETLNYLMKVLCEVERLDLALKQFSRMNKKQCTPNSRTFEILISSLCLNDRIDEAVKMLDWMLQICCSPDLDFYDRVIPLLCRVDRFEEGIMLFKLMKGAGLQLNFLYEILIQCLCRNQIMDVAIELFEEMTDLGISPKIATYVDIVDGYCKVKKLDEAASFLDGDRVSEVEPYNTLLKSYIDMGMHGQAIAYLNKMIQRGLTDSLSWNITIKGLCQEGYIQKAFEVIGRMVASCYMPEEATYSALIIGYCSTCDYDNALNIFRQSRLYNLSLESDCYSQLINGLCGVKKIQEAAEVFYHAMGKGCLVTSYSLDIVIQRLCQTGRVHEAIRMHSLAVGTGISCLPSTYGTIFLALLGINNKKNILPFLSQMLVRCWEFDAATYCILIRGFCTAGMSIEAALAFNQMIDASFYPNAETLEVLVVKLAKVRQLHRVAHNLHKVIKDVKLLSPKMCNMVIYGLSREGHKLEASTFLDRMLEIGWIPDAEAHVMLIGNMDVEKKDRETLPKDACNDKVSNILAEGLYVSDDHIVEE